MWLFHREFSDWYLFLPLASYRYTFLSQISATHSELECVESIIMNDYVL